MTSFKGFSKGVARFSKGFSKGVVRFSKGVARFSKGVARFSSGCVTASSGCVVTACSRESDSKILETHPEFLHVTLTVLDRDKKNVWLRDLDRIIASLEGPNSWFVDENDKVQISITIHRSQLIRRLSKFSRKLKVDYIQGGDCRNNLFRKKEAPKKEVPKSNNANTAVGYYQPQGYGGYYGNVALSGYGGYDNVGFYGNGGYNGNIYNYQPEPAVYQKRIGYDHIDCAGDASGCSGYHIEKAVTPDKTQDKSSKNTVEKPAGSPKRN